MAKDSWRKGLSFLLKISFSFACLSGCRAVMTGGISQVVDPESDPVIMDGVERFLKNYNTNNGQVYKFLCRTLQASVQVVEGGLYRVAMKIVPDGEYDKTDVVACVKQSSYSRDEGDIDRRLRFVCFTIWSRPWLKDKKLQFIIEEKQNIRRYEACLSGG